MKYMTFNSSCPYAGLANMLSSHGLETDDRTIALEMGLPYYFSREGDTFLAGPSLQSAPWFNLYLNPQGFSMCETAVPKQDVAGYLRSQKCAMLGLQLENAPKHAFVYTGISDTQLRFLNNKWAHDSAPETLLLTEASLLQHLEETCIIATLERTTPTCAPIQARMAASLDVLAEYRQVLTQICGQLYPTSQLRQMLNPTFRALLLDGITMLELLNQRALHDKAVQAQHLLLTALRSDTPELRLGDLLSPELLNEIITDYQALIRQAIA